MNEKEMEQKVDEECPNFEEMMEQIREEQEEKMKHMPPEYATSTCHLERWIDSYFDYEATRDVPSGSGNNDVEEDELRLDYLNVLIDNQKKYQKWFREDWKEKGLSCCQYLLFVRTIKREMYGRSVTRNSNNALRLKRSVYNYLKKRKLLSEPDTLGTEELLSVTPLFTEEEISKILEINKSIFNLMIDDLCHANQERSSNDYTLKRGLHTDVIVDEKNFFEKFTINSYTLANSISDKFANGKGDIHTVVRTPATIWDDAILFNSIIFPPPSGEQQFEFGVIPFPKYERLCYKGVYASMHECELDRTDRNSL